jgi:hypothetical protein
MFDCKTGAIGVRCFATEGRCDRQRDDAPVSGALYGRAAQSLGKCARKASVNRLKSM